MSYSKENPSEHKPDHRQQILVCGIDLGKEEHFFEFADPEGQVIAREKLEHNFAAVRRWVGRLDEYRRQHGYRDILFAMEGTGHMWMQMASYLQRMGFEARLVRNAAVKSQRKISGQHGHRSDRRAAHHITELALGGKVLERQLEIEEPWVSLRCWASEYQLLVDDATAEKQRLRDFLHMIYPAYDEFFSDPFRMTSMAVLQVIGQAHSLSEEQFIRKVRSHFPGRRLSVKKCKRLHAYIQSEPAWGYMEAREAVEVRVKSAAERLKLLESQKSRMRRHLLDAYERSGYQHNLDSIHGTQSVHNAVALGLLGDPAQFHSSAAVVRLSGLDVGENTSGDHTGETTITKTGRSQLRRAAICAAKLIINSRKNAAFSDKFYSLITKKNFKKYQAYCALAAKYLRTLWYLSVHGETYDPLIAKNGLAATPGGSSDEQSLNDVPLPEVR